MPQLYNFMLYLGSDKRPIEQPVYAESQEDANDIVQNLYQNYQYTWELISD